MKKLFFMYLLMMMTSLSASAHPEHHPRHHAHQPAVIFSDPWLPNYRTPHYVPQYQPPLYIPPQVTIYERPQRLITVCGPIYKILTPHGYEFRKNCWQELR